MGSAAIFRRRAWVPICLGLMLLAACLTAYSPIRLLPFINIDDPLYVTDNLHIKYDLDWEAVKWSFTTFHAANWHPVTWLSHAVDCHFFFLNPARHHEVNLFLHVLNVLLLFGVLWRATGYAGRSFMVAALFAVHPINVETVAWVAERKNLLSMFFILLGLGIYRWYALKPQLSRYCAVAAVYALALMSKPQAVTFPCVLLLWDYWPLRRFSLGREPEAGEQSSAIPSRSMAWLCLEKLPLLLLSAASSAVTMMAQRAGGALNTAMSTFPFSERLANAVVSYCRYLSKAFWPANLSFFYPRAPGSIATWQVVAGLAFLIGMTAATLYLRERRYLIVGWLWYLGTLVPMIGLVQVSAQAMADRYAYLSLIGIFIMVCWALGDLADQWKPAARLVPVASVIAIVALVFLTQRQLSYWSDDLTLWSHAAEATRNNYLAEDMVGSALLDEGAPEKAIVHFRRSVAIYPGVPSTHFYIASYDQQHGKLREALKHYQDVIDLTQSERVAGGNLRALTFTKMSDIYRELGDIAKAQQNLNFATRQNEANQTHPD